MRKLFVSTSCVLVLLLNFIGASEGAPFVNLDFEQSTVQPGDPPVVPAAAAFPGWSAQFDNVPTEFVYHDRLGAGEPVVAIFDQPIANGSVALLQGRFMPLIGPGTPDTRTTLSQVGDIPLGSRSITFLSAGLAPPPIVRINGEAIPTVFLSGIDSIGQVVTYGADIMSFAGMTVELRFECGHYVPSGETGNRVFDDIRFSAMPIPEPGSSGVAILFLTGVTVTRRRTRKKGSQRVRKGE